METISLGPFRSAVIQWQPRPGSWTLSAMAKATFRLHPGEAQLAADQETIFEADHYREDGEQHGLSTPSDMVPFKPLVDVILIGSAYAPNRTPTRSLIAAISAGDMIKAVEVHCDRAMMADGSIQEGTGFTRMPLTYERAAGGPGTWNPLGIAADRRDPYNRVVLPNFQPVGFVPTMHTPIEPMGFGPIAPQWPQRAEKITPGLTTPTVQSLSDTPLPTGIDGKFFNAAPLDQQLANVPENMQFFLENLHPEFPKLRCRLPAMRPAFFVQAPDRPAQKLTARIDTILFDTDFLVFTVSWRAQLPLGHCDEWSRLVTTVETGTQSLAWADVEAHVPAMTKSLETTKNVPSSLLADKVETRNYRVIPSIAKQGAVAEASGQRSGALPFLPAPRPRADTLLPKDDTGPHINTALPFASKTPTLTSASAKAPAPIQPPPLPTAAPPAAVSEVSPWASPAPSASAPAIEGSQVVVASMSAPPATPAMPAISAMPAMPAMAASPASGMNVPHADAAVVANSLNPNFKGSFSSVTASNAAAAVAWTAPAVAAKPSAPAAPFVPRTSSRLEPPEINQLLWFDEESVPRFRRNAEWKPILKELERKPRDKDLDDPVLADNPTEMEDRREVFEILTHGTPKNYDGLQSLYFDAIRDDGKFVPPLALVAGELTFPFDEMETLKATVTTVSPLVTPSDENLRISVENAKEFLKTPGLSSAPAVSEGLTTRIKEAFAQGRRSVQSGYLDVQTERVLLEQRHYQKRSVFGARYLRALLPMSGSQSSLPAYIPEDMAARLPMYQRFRVRLILELGQQEDQYENHTLSLRVLALSRITLSPKR